MIPEIPILTNPLLPNGKEWNYPNAKRGGSIDPELFELLNKNCNKKIINIYGVSSSLNGQEEFGSYRSTIQSGIVAQLEDGTFICVEKCASSYWKGGNCNYNAKTGKYEFNNEEYAKEWVKHFNNNNYCGSLIAGMKTDPNEYSQNYGSQDSRQHLMSELGEYVPAPSKWQIFTDKLRDLAHDVSETLHKYTDDIPFPLYFVPVVGPILRGIDYVKSALDFDIGDFVESVLTEKLENYGEKIASGILKHKVKVKKAGKSLVKGVTKASKQLKNDISKANQKYNQAKTLSNTKKDKIESKKIITEARKEFWHDTKKATKEFGHKTGKEIKDFGKKAADISIDIKNGVIKDSIDFGKERIQACTDTVKKTFNKVGEIKNDLVNIGSKFGGKAINSGKDLKNNISNAITQKKRIRNE